MAACPPSEDGETGGLELLTAEGASDGGTDGCEDGEFVTGCADGRTVGSSVGADGWTVGVSVGAVGPTEGVSVGPLVTGALLGPTDTVIEGMVEGARVGLLDGTRAGAALGETDSGTPVGPSVPAAPDGATDGWTTGLADTDEGCEEGEAKDRGTVLGLTDGTAGNPTGLRQFGTDGCWHWR